MDSKVLTCTSLGSKCSRCTLWARNIRSLKGRANRASTSATVHTLRPWAAPMPAAISFMLVHLDAHVLPVFLAALDNVVHAQGHQHHQAQHPHPDPHGQGLDVEESLN